MIALAEKKKMKQFEYAIRKAGGTASVVRKTGEGV
jgi:hypothetical protein